MPSILALEVRRRGSIEGARAIYCGTFSKVLAPGLRVGWVVEPTALIRRLVLIKQASDLNSATINQMVMHRMAEAAFDAQVKRARAHYRQRRDWLLAALERHMPAGVTWTRPHGGLFVWVTLPNGIDAAGLLQRSQNLLGALAERRALFGGFRLRETDQQLAVGGVAVRLNHRFTRDGRRDGAAHLLDGHGLIEPDDDDRAAREVDAQRDAAARDDRREPRADHRQ